MCPNIALAVTIPLTVTQKASVIQKIIPSLKEFCNYRPTELTEGNPVLRKEFWHVGVKRSLGSSLFFLIVTSTLKE